MPSTRTRGPLRAALLPLAAMLALSACSLTRPPANLAAPLPGHWQTPLPPTPISDSAALPHGGSLPALSQWWGQLGDPLLLRLIEAAQAASPDLADAAARIADARANSVAAGAALLPGLQGALSANRGNTQAGGGGPAEGSAGAAASAAPMTVLQAGLQASWEIDLFGRLRAGSDAASLRLAGADASWHQARVAVAAETANQYFNARACERQSAVAERDATSRAETARLTDLSMRAGFTAPADAALARASAAEAAARLTQQTAQCAQARAGLVALTGLDADALRDSLASTTTPSALAGIAVIDSVPAAALSQRPDIYAAEQAVAAASADVGAAQAERYPRLSLNGSIGRLQLRTQGQRQTLDTWSVGPVSLTLPIFDGGQRKANAQAAQVRWEAAASRLRGDARQAVREVEEALIALDSTAQRERNSSTAVENYQASFDGTQARYQSGLASLFELEDARRTLFASQTAQIALQRERAQAGVALYRAMGGGWTRPDGAPALAAAPTGKPDAAAAYPLLSSSATASAPP